MYDVAIIGGGPVGALASNLLGKYGLKTLVVEKEPKPFPLPRAVHLDHEMVRLMQALGLTEKVLPDMRDTAGHLHIGADHGVIRYMGTAGKPRPFGWSNDYFFYQPELEDHLRNAITQYPNVELRLGTEFIQLQQQPGKVDITLKTNSETYQETARWVIGCDGARSLVRKQLGIQLDDLDFEEPWLVVDAEVDGEVKFPDLTGVPEGADLQHLSIMMCDPVRPATMVPGPRNLRRWELMLLPGEDDQQMMNSEKVTELLAPYLSSVPHNIVRASTYRFHGLVALKWQEDNVFLAGDAAHQTPPFFGQGMCHGFRDVANLCWKMASIVNKAASPLLLNSYQTERDPHVRSVISAAVGAGRYICILDKDKAAERDIEIRDKVKRNELPTTAADLIPPIQSGIIATGTPKCGVRFIQPWLELAGEKRLLDDIAPGHWRMFVNHSDLLKSAQEAAQQLVPNLEVQVYDASEFGPNNALLNWLKECQSNMVLLRPDYYVYGTSYDSAHNLFIQLSAQLLVENVKQEKTA